MRTYAHIRKDLIDDEEFGRASICITREEWERLDFLCMQLDDEDETPFSEKDHPDGYNMILLHPETHQLFWGYSYEFNFTDEPRIKMNNLQKIASQISGYDPVESGARDDYYYELPTKGQKLAYLLILGPITVKEANKIYDFLEREFSSGDDMYYAFKELGEETK